jgi:hypothetical protein
LNKKHTVIMNKFVQNRVKKEAESF